jgi:hypothetical protein
MLIRKDIPLMSRCQDTTRRIVYNISLISLFILILCSIAVLPVWALQTAGDPMISPGKTLVAGDEASVYVEVIYSVSSMSEYMDLTTGLSDARWRVEIQSDGRTVGEVQRSGRYAGITGFELFNSGFTKLLVHLNGTVSEGFYGSGEQTLMSIDHIAADGTTVLDTLEVKAVVLTAADVTILREVAVSDLGNLGGLIRTADAEGIDTTEAQEAYADAEDLIAASETMPPADAFAAITSAGDLIDGATSCLSEGMYLQTVSSAETTISKTENLLVDYEQSSGYSSGGAMVVQSQLESAGTFLILAQEKKKGGDYLSALSYAQQARSKADGSMEYLTSLTEGTGISGEISPTPSSTPAPAATGTIVIIDPEMTPVSGSEGFELSGFTNLLEILWGGVSGAVQYINQLADAVNKLIG